MRSAQQGCTLQTSKKMKPKPLYRSLYFQVLVAIALGVTIGYAHPDLGAQMKPLGEGFIRLIKMI
ncbi:MAG TPA: cation:dicarboxylase symporter family transporter, partial [Steroidobacteraceae bacterium]|nr:cation:dicarboxylase symporter family transporter [Steroidobacteraceae bacterium]